MRIKHIIVGCLISGMAGCTTPELTQDQLKSYLESRLNERDRSLISIEVSSFEDAPRTNVRKIPFKVSYRYKEPTYRVLSLKKIDKNDSSTWQYKVKEQSSSNTTIMTHGEVFILTHRGEITIKGIDIDSQPFTEVGYFKHHFDNRQVTWLKQTGAQPEPQLTNEHQHLISALNSQTNTKYKFSTQYLSSQ